MEWRAIGAFFILSLGLTAGCQSEQSVFDPRTPQARDILNLWWLMLGLGTLTFAGVMAFLAAALFRRRRDDEDPRSRGSVGVVLLAGAAFPAVVVFVLMAAMLQVMVKDDSDPDELRIEVIGHQYWWEVRYPDLGFETANEIHVPVGRTVKLELTSNDVIHSFWIPQLHGKIDLIPGQVNEMRFRVLDAGEYRGQCAEFCGVQHGNMLLLLIAENDFDSWAAAQAEPAAVPTDPRLVRGQQIFFGSSCVYCHAIRGTGASGNLGPDLTHLAGRRTLGAGVLYNNAGSLAGWVADPHVSKPGNLMPASDLDPESLDLLIEYLRSLE